jgi:hypothetical protein
MTLACIDRRRGLVPSATTCPIGAKPASSFATSSIFMEKFSHSRSLPSRMRANPRVNLPDNADKSADAWNPGSAMFRDFRRLDVSLRAISTQDGDEDVVGYDPVLHGDLRPTRQC